MSRNPDDTAVAVKTCMIFKVVRPVRKAKAAMEFIMDYMPAQGVKVHDEGMFPWAACFACYIEITGMSGLTDIPPFSS